MRRAAVDHRRRAPGALGILLLTALLTFHASPAPVRAFAQSPEFPRALVDTKLVDTTGATIGVPAGGDLQAALDAAQPGDAIVLEAGAVYRGPFRLPRKAGDQWITVTSSSAPELPVGQRVAPSDAPRMAVLEGGQPSVVMTEPGAHHYRLVGLEIRPAADTFMFNIVDVGSDAKDTAEVPHHLIFDRCYLHGDRGLGSRRAVAMNGAYVAVVESYLADLKEVKNDSQAIAGWSGPGPFKIVNNYLEAAGENVMFGGADPRLPGLVPSDIEIRDNDITRPWSWWREHPDYDGSQWTVKNLLELKNARRVLIEDNRFSHHWPDAQQGFAIVLTPRNQDGTAPWSRVEDVTFADNELRDIASGVNIAAFDDWHPEATLARVLIQDNVFAGLGTTAGKARAFQLLDGPPDITIDHNTIAPGPTPDCFLMFDGQQPEPSLVVRDNVLPYGLYGMYGVSVGSGSAALSVYAPDAIFEGNVVYGFDPATLGWIQSHYPAGNTYVPGVVDLASIAGGPSESEVSAGPGSSRATGVKANRFLPGARARAAQSVANDSSLSPATQSGEPAPTAPAGGMGWYVSPPSRSPEPAECGVRFFDECQTTGDSEAYRFSGEPLADAARSPESQSMAGPIGAAPVWANEDLLSGAAGRAPASPALASHLIVQDRDVVDSEGAQLGSSSSEATPTAQPSGQ
jgi:hypothetical protein